MGVKSFIKNNIDNHWRWFLTLSYRGLANWLPDKLYLELKYRAMLNCKLNLKNPQTFNEKLQWLKLYDRKGIYTTLVDKYLVKKFVSGIIGPQYIIPTLGVWDSFDDIDFSQMPNEYVIKCTHDSGGVAIIKDADNTDLAEVKEKISKCLNNNFYNYGREWPYKSVRPRIIAEKYMEDSKTSELRDYKFFCFNGIVKCFKIDFDRFIQHRANYYNNDGYLLSFGEVSCPPDFERRIEIPNTLKEMVSLAERISKGFPFLRVDFYDVDGQIYFGELTLYPASGFGKFTSEEWDMKLGEWLELPMTRSAKSENLLSH